MSVLIAPVMQYLHAAAVAILLGKVVLLSFVVAPILAKNLEREAFGKVVGELFPAYYRLGMATAAGGLVSVTGLLSLQGLNPSLLAAGGIWLLILAAESYCRSPLTPQSNAMRDRLKEQGQRGAVDALLQADWSRLHQRSIYLNSIVLIGGLTLLGVARQF
jgi:hypothetical protein